VLKRLCAGALVAGLLVVAPPADAAKAPAKGRLTHASYTQPGGLTRGYFVYTPAGLAPNRPVVLYLHGCNQTATQAMTATGFNTLADKERFAVVYPEQVVAAGSSAPVSDGNGVGCWNWFLPQDQERGSGEPGVLVGIVQKVTALTHGDRKRVYVEGISAGAAMTVNLAATYPDVFAAAASIAGCSYRTCSDESGSLTHTAMGAHARVVPMFVENGTADVLNPAAQSEDLVQSWLGADDLADNGTADQSISRQAATQRTTMPDGTPVPGSGDPCVHSNSFGCIGGVAGLSDYPVTVQTWNDAGGRDVMELWLVHGLAHAQPHAPSGEPYSDPLGPDITAASYRFFARQHL
jgi:poly(hydroxyalkanoate) depolymerase family esterase